MELQEIEFLLNQKDSDLYRQIGDEILSISVGIRPPTELEKEQEGRLWFSENRDTLKELICKSNTVTIYLQSERSQERVLTVASTADLISGLLTGISAFSVSILIVREGLMTFCKN